MLSLMLALCAGPPNLVLVVADDCTWRDLGCYGGQAATPRLDTLAREGMRMDSAFQAAPMCSPTRHTIYTGLYPVRSGAYPNHTFVNDGVRSVVQYLRPRGYRLALSGKRHVAPREVFDFEYSGRGNNPDMRAIDGLMAECRKSDTPFCLIACSNEPHTPWDRGDPVAYPPRSLRLPPHWVDTPGTRKAYSRYLAEITVFDTQVGQIVDLLDRHNLTGDTLLMVVSEQGGSFPFAKWTLYDDGIRSGMLVRWPGRISPGSTSDALVEYVDILPTFLEAAGVEEPDTLEGESLLPLLRGERNEHKTFVFAMQTSRGIHDGPEHFGRRSVRSARYKPIRNLNGDVPFQGALTRQPFFGEWETAAGSDPDVAALVRKVRRPPEWELYDTRVDPYEQRNLAGQEDLSEVRDRLAEELAAWMESQGDRGLATEMEALTRMKKPGRASPK